MRLLRKSSLRDFTESMSTHAAVAEDAMDMMEDVADAVAEAARMAIVVAVATIAAADVTKMI